MADIKAAIIPALTGRKKPGAGLLLDLQTLGMPEVPPEASSSEVDIFEGCPLPQQVLRADSMAQLWV